MEPPAEDLEESHGAKAATRYVVVALFGTVSSEFSRRQWPAHVTLAPNFVTRASADEVMSAVRRVNPGSSLVVQFGGRAAFAPEGDVPVQLVIPGPVITLHRALADLLEILPGFRADEPAYWRGGYRPHVTLGSRIAADEGTHHAVASIALTRLDGEIATVLDVVPLSDVGQHVLPGRGESDVVQ